MKRDELSASLSKSSSPRKKTKRRAVACKACHSLKVKCIPSDPNDLASPCVRCLKGQRECEIDAPLGRKKKKPEDRVAELELRLEQLTSQLQQGSSPVSQSSESSFHQTSPRVSSSVPRSHFGYSFSPKVSQINITHPSSLGPATKKQTPPPTTEYEDDLEQFKKARIRKAQLIEEKFGPKKLHDISTSVTAAHQIRVASLTTAPVDIINDGYLTLEEARIRWELYENSIYPKYPFVPIPDDFEAARKDHPILFTTLMSIMGTLRPSDVSPNIEANLQLLNLAQKEILNEVMFIGNKSMDLLKSLTLWTVWYNAPEMFHHRRYHIFSGLCISLCHDLGLTGRPYFVVNKQEGAVRRTVMLEEPQKEEYKCLVLTIYCLSTGYMLFLRRKLPVTWSPYLDECYETLSSSPDKRHQTIGVFAKLTSLMEKVDAFINVQDQENSPLVKYFTQEIEALNAQEVTMDDTVLKAFSSSIEAFLYSKFTEKVFLLKCLQSSINCISCFSSMSAEEMNHVPLVIFGRLMYCFALFLRTCNVLRHDFDLGFIEKLLNNLRECSEIYKNNHIVLKIRLLLHFYLTTFAKNEDIFNSINDVPSQYAISKSVNEPNGSNQRPDVHVSNSVPNLHSLMNGKTDFQSEPVQHALSLSVDSHNLMQQQIKGMNYGFPGIHGSDPLNNGQVLYSNETGDGYPRIDMLSDATMKGFMDVPNDLLGSQDEFWKLFDYKQDDQFYL